MSVAPQVIVAGIVMGVSFVAVLIGCICPRGELHIEFENPGGIDDELEMELLSLDVA